MTQVLSKPKVRPIIFPRSKADAISDGEITTTRRLIPWDGIFYGTIYGHLQEDYGRHIRFGWENGVHFFSVISEGSPDIDYAIKQCRYGRIGDRLAAMISRAPHYQRRELEITGVDAIRLKDVDQDAAISEGDHFRRLWEKAIAYGDRRGLPWVWEIQFKYLSCDSDRNGPRSGVRSAAENGTHAERGP